MPRYTYLPFYKRKDINNVSKYNDIAENELNEGIDIVETLLQGITVNREKIRDFNYEHETNDCSCDTSTRTEKRLCRCLALYSKENENCQKCQLFNNEFFGKKIKNAKVIDYEIPVTGDGKDGIGKIDLLFKYDEDGKIYFTEVKPQWNTETILRMVAEIITYAELLKRHCSEVNSAAEEFRRKYNVPVTDCQKAILFMENSKQQRFWTDEKYKYYVSDRLKKIIKEQNIAVFCLCMSGNNYYLKKYNI